MASNDRFRVLQVTHLKDWPHQDVAHSLLMRAVEVGNVLLGRHRWTVGQVSEFFPRDVNLLGLNVNRGEHVKIRLRPPNSRAKREESKHSPADFYPFEHIMCTFVHELVHNTISEHDESFWKKYHELVAEAEIILATIASGGTVPKDSQEKFLPFAGRGRKLGGSTTRLDSTNLAQRRAILCGAAQRRLSSLQIMAVHSEQVMSGKSPLGCGGCLAAAQQPDNEPQWNCTVCDSRNHFALPYCEWCSSVRDDKGKSKRCRSPVKKSIPHFHVVTDSDDE